MPKRPKHDRRYQGEEKQSERLEVRLGPSLRDRFLAACQRAGDTPSAVLRHAMAEYVSSLDLAERKTLTQELIMKLIHNPLKMAGMALTSLAAFTLMAAPGSADEKLFKALDSNGDGVLTKTDNAPLDKVVFVLDEDNSDSITLDEFRIAARYARIFARPQADGAFQVQADQVTMNEAANRAEYAGRVGFKWARTASGDQPDFITEDGADIVSSLVTIDLSAPGEVRFKTQTLTIAELTAIDRLDRVIIELQ